MAEPEAHSRLLGSEARVKFTVVHAKNVPMWGRRCTVINPPVLLHQC